MVANMSLYLGDVVTRLSYLGSRENYNLFGVSCNSLAFVHALQLPQAAPLNRSCRTVKIQRPVSGFTKITIQVILLGMNLGARA